MWAAIIVAAVATGYALGYFVKTPAGDGMAVAGVPVVPPVKGYAEGQAIYFIRTEASGPKVAELLTAMMRSPVLHVPALAQARRAPGEVEERRSGARAQGGGPAEGGRGRGPGIVVNMPMLAWPGSRR